MESTSTYKRFEFGAGKPLNHYQKERHVKYLKQVYSTHNIILDYSIQHSVGTIWPQAVEIRPEG